MIDTSTRSTSYFFTRPCCSHRLPTSLHESFGSIGSRIHLPLSLSLGHRAFSSRRRRRNRGSSLSLLTLAEKGNVSFARLYAQRRRSLTRGSRSRRKRINLHFSRLITRITVHSETHARVSDKVKSAPIFEHSSVFLSLPAIAGLYFH